MGTHKLTHKISYSHARCTPTTRSKQLENPSKWK